VVKNDIFFLAKEHPFSLGRSSSSSKEEKRFFGNLHFPNSTLSFMSSGDFSTGLHLFHVPRRAVVNWMESQDLLVSKGKCGYLYIQHTTGK
jgi:hypothetical protein